MTLIAVATLRTATLEESMSANSRLRQVAVNAAETALTEAERVVLSLDPWERRGRFFATGFVGPEPGVANKGDSCRLGFCTPRKFTNLLDSTFVIPDQERWADPDLDVWNDSTKHMVYSTFETSDLQEEGVFEAPRYIIEFLGNYESPGEAVGFASNPTIRPRFTDKFDSSRCLDPVTGFIRPPSDVWPFCPQDPAIYRVTVRAVAGPESRQAVVFLQSIIKTPFD